MKFQDNFWNVQDCSEKSTNSVRRGDVAPCELGSHGYSQWRKAEVAFLSGELGATLEPAGSCEAKLRGHWMPDITLTSPRSALPLLLQLEKAVGRVPILVGKAN